MSEHGTEAGLASHRADLLDKQALQRREQVETQVAVRVGWLVEEVEAWSRELDHSF